MATPHFGTSLGPERSPIPEGMERPAPAERARGILEGVRGGTLVIDQGLYEYKILQHSPASGFGEGYRVYTLSDPAQFEAAVLHLAQYIEKSNSMKQ